MMHRIRIHGRGGQGGKMLAKMIGEAAFLEGYWVQDFSLYGAERRGAPVQAFVRIDKKEILERGYIEKPDTVVLLDDSLFGKVDISRGLKVGGLMLVNTKKEFDFPNFVGIDAVEISLKTLGKPIYNTVMLGAFTKASRIFGAESAEKAMVKELRHKYHSERTIRKNIAAFRAGYESVGA